MNCGNTHEMEDVGEERIQEYIWFMFEFLLTLDEESSFGKTGIGSEKNE